MIYGSTFTGIGGFDLAADKAGMRCAWQCELDAACNSVLSREWEDETRYNDVRQLLALLEPRNAKRIRQPKPVRPDLVCGGFPCQDLSVAGRRAGFAGCRSGLWFIFRRIIALLRPEWVLIENVPGLLSSHRGRDMGAVLGGLARLGYGWSYRCLDSQWFGLAQRRLRVFIVGHSGGQPRRAAEVLFERDCLPWDLAPSRQTGTSLAASLTRGAESSGRGGYAGRRREDDVNLVARTICAGGNDRQDESRMTYVVGTIQATDGGMASPDRCGELVVANACTHHRGRNSGEDNLIAVAHTLRSEGADASEDGTGRGTPLVAFNYQAGGSKAMMGFSRTHTTALGSTQTPAVAFQTRIARNGRGQPKEITDALTSSEDSKPHVAGSMGVRRLTPLECERLQGFPDDWTRYAADGSEISDSARYRMLGNAVSVPVVEWILRRLNAGN